MSKDIVPFPPASLESRVDRIEDGVDELVEASFRLLAIATGEIVVPIPESTIN